MMISRYYGIPKELCQLQAETLKNTKFKIRTALGDSQRTYQHSRETPIHGTGQGSCASPAIWLLTSSFLMTILQENTYGMQMKDIEECRKTLQQLIDAFVDDTSIFTNEETNDIKKLREKLQHDGAWWAGLLESSGGKLELTKCFYYLLTWKWGKYGDPEPELIKEQSQEDGSERISLNQNDNKPVFLEQKEINKSHKTLGTYKNMMGNEEEHMIFMKEKSRTFEVKTSNSQFN
jgi:hypothetical protein